MPQRKRAAPSFAATAGQIEAQIITADVQAHHRAAYAALQQGNQQPAITSSSSSRSGGGGGGDNMNKRKRERELEQELLQGNVAALDGTDIHTRDMRLDGQTWADKVDYFARKDEEEKVRQEFSVASAGGAAVGSKLQKSRHQLSSMAAQAVQSKIAQLERKRVQKENSADRRAKYGF